MRDVHIHRRGVLINRLGTCICAYVVDLRSSCTRPSKPFITIASFGVFLPNSYLWFDVQTSYIGHAVCLTDMASKSTDHGKHSYSLTPTTSQNRCTASLKRKQRPPLRLILPALANFSSINMLCRTEYSPSYSGASIREILGELRLTLTIGGTTCPGQDPAC
jgi:hypothetical protein